MKRGQSPFEYTTIVVIIVLVGAAITGFLSSNFWAKKFGGKITVTLPPGATFINATWKDSDLWYLYRTASGSVVMQEQSPYGLLQGQVEFVERKAEK